ncbi:MAG: hypothetical protein AMXMBFR12_04480 [Candidatus Babeliales bacterium]
MQENRTPEQLVQQALAELPRIRQELGKPVNPNHQQGQPPPIGAPNQRDIDLHKRRLQGDPLNRVCAAIAAGQERLHAQRNVQEAIAHTTIITAAAQEAALQECLGQKGTLLTQAESNSREAAGQLGTLQEIKQKQEQQKQKRADLEKSCKDLQFLNEVKELDDKLDHLAHHLSHLDLELTGEIMAAQQALRELKHS